MGSDVNGAHQVNSNRRWGELWWCRWPSHRLFCVCSSLALPSPRSRRWQPHRCFCAVLHASPSLVIFSCLWIKGLSNIDITESDLLLQKCFLTTGSRIIREVKWDLDLIHYRGNNNCRHSSADKKLCRVDWIMLLMTHQRPKDVQLCNVDSCVRCGCRAFTGSQNLWSSSMISVRVTAHVLAVQFQHGVLTRKRTKFYGVKS